jgi:hypothetical protein
MSQCCQSSWDSSSSHQLWGEAVSRSVSKPTAGISDWLLCFSLVHVSLHGIGCSPGNRPKLQPLYCQAGWSSARDVSVDRDTLSQQQQLVLPGQHCSQPAPTCMSPAILAWNSGPPDTNMVVTLPLESFTTDTQSGSMSVPMDTDSMWASARRSRGTSSFLGATMTRVLVALVVLLGCCCWRWLPLRSSILAACLCGRKAGGGRGAGGRVNWVPVGGYRTDGWCDG